MNYCHSGNSRRGIIQALLGLAVFLMADQCAADQPQADSLTLQWEQLQLENGLTVVLQPDPDADEVSVEFWIKAGTRNEVPGKFGLAHFVEHATPYGLRGDSVALARLRAGMTNSNAQTRKDYTRYYIQVKRETFDVAVRYAAERFQADTAAITDEMIERHRKSVLAEIERNSSNVFWDFKAGSVRDAGTFGASHPYGHGAYGTLEENRNFTAEHVRSWYNRFLVPRNAILFLVGGFDVTDARDLVRREFEDINGGEKSAPGSMPEVRTSGERVTMRTASKNHALSITWAIHGAGLSDEAALCLAARILDERLSNSTDLPASTVASGSSYLMRRYEHGLQFGLFCTFSSPTDSVGIEERLPAFLRDLTESGISANELQEARRKEIESVWEFIGELGFIGSRTELLGEGLLFKGNPDYYRALVQHEAALKARDVQDAVRKWLSNEPFVLLCRSKEDVE